MAYLLLSRFMALGATLLLSGCCANDVCNCNDEQEDKIDLVFSSAFTPADLDTVFLQRYPLIIKPDTKPETFILIRDAKRVYEPIELNNTTPFPQLGSARLNNYKYVVSYNDTTRQQRLTIALIVDKVDLKGSLDGDGCCTCYHNLSKGFTFRKDNTTLEEADSTVNIKARPVPVFIIYK